MVTEMVWWHLAFSSCTNSGCYEWIRATSRGSGCVICREKTTVALYCNGGNELTKCGWTVGIWTGVRACVSRQRIGQRSVGRGAHDPDHRMTRLEAPVTGVWRSEVPGFSGGSNARLRCETLLSFRSVTATGE